MLQGDDMKSQVKAAVNEVKSSTKIDADSQKSDKPPMQTPRK